MAPFVGGTSSVKARGLACCRCGMLGGCSRGTAADVGGGALDGAGSATSPSRDGVKPEETT